MRVVSLVPSSTETLLALGANVVACTRFCEQPDLAHVGGTKRPDIAAIVALAPDVVVLDREENRIEDAHALGAAGVELLVTDVRSLTDALDAVEQLAALVGTQPPPLRLPDATPERADPVAAFVPIWRRPWMSIGPATYGTSLLDHLGVRLVTADAAVPYPVVELADVAEARPDVVLVPSEPYDFDERHLDELRAACQDAVVSHVDGQDLFWWGIRTPAAVARLDATIRAALS